MRFCNAPKIVLCVSAIVVLSASLANALASDPPLTPRLAALHARLQSGDRKALDSFWKEIEQHGAPMIEAATDSDREMLVTIEQRASGHAGEKDAAASAESQRQYDFQVAGAHGGGGCGNLRVFQ